MLKYFCVVMKRRRKLASHSSIGRCSNMIDYNDDGNVIMMMMMIMRMMMMMMMMMMMLYRIATSIIYIFVGLDNGQSYDRP